MMEKRGIITEQTPDSSIKKGCSGNCGCHCSNVKEAQDAHDQHIASRLTDEATEAFRKK